MDYSVWTMNAPSRNRVVEVFKTNVIYQKQAMEVIDMLRHEFPSFRINMDLSDCDRILRVEGYQVFPEKIIALVTMYGYECFVLE